MVGADRMVQWVNMLAAEPVDLSSIPRPYMVGENQLLLVGYLLLYVSPRAAI